MPSDSGYSFWKNAHETTLKTFPDKNIILLFSGGKDSSVAMDFIQTASNEFGFNFSAYAATFPVHRYTAAEKERIESYWLKRGSEIIWHDIEKTDAALTGSEDPCLMCQKLRKNLLKRILTQSIEDWGSLVIIVSYSLWDIVSYSLEHLLNGILSDAHQETGDEKNSRFKETAQRFYPLLKMKEGYTVFRPLITYNNQDIIQIILKKNIPILSIPCQFKDFRPKRILEKYYEKMGLRFNYDQLFNFAKKSLNLPGISDYASIPKEEYLLRIF
jgi:tRNA(Ile)-lysidine synthase TilS/MesJ